MYSSLPIRSLRDILAGAFAVKVSATGRMYPCPFLVGKVALTKISHAAVVYDDYSESRWMYWKNCARI